MNAAACRSTIWKEYVTNIITKNIKRERENGIVSTKTVALFRYKHISTSAAQTVPPVCVF